MIRITNQNIKMLYPPPNCYLIKLLESGELFTSILQIFSIARKEKIFYPVSTYTQLPFNLYYLFKRGPPEPRDIPHEWNSLPNIISGSGFSPCLLYGTPCNAFLERFLRLSRFNWGCFPSGASICHSEEMSYMTEESHFDNSEIHIVILNVSHSPLLPFSLSQLLLFTKHGRQTKLL